MNEIIILILIYYFISVIVFSIISYKKTLKKINLSDSNGMLNNTFLNDLNERLI